MFRRQNLGSGSQSAVTAVAVRPDGEILAAGVVGDLPTGAPTAAAVDLYFGGEADGAIVRVDDDHAVDTNNPTPALPLSGDATVPANTPYTLTLGDGMADLGSGSNVSYVVNWGDGNSDPPISADDLAAQDDQVTHTYATAATDPITVDLDVAGDPNSPYLVGSESQPVTVDFSRRHHDQPRFHHLARGFRELRCADGNRDAHSVGNRHARRDSRVL